MALHDGTAPVYYGADRATVHIGRVVWHSPERPPYPRPVAGYCDNPDALTLAEAVSVTCPDCLAEANRRTTRKEANR